MGNGKSKTLGEEDLNFLMKNTSYSEADIKDLYKKFIEECPEGRLSPQKFMQTYQMFFPSGNTEQFCDYVFRSFDMDRDGYIDFRELMLAIGITSRGSAQEKLQWAFRLYDADRDGSVAMAEMYNIIRSINDMVGAGSKEAEKATTIFRRMDSDQDGRITEEEFVGACLKDGNLAKMLTPDFVTDVPLLRKASVTK